MGVSGAARGWEELGQWTLESLLGAATGLAAARWVVPGAWYPGRLWAAVLLIAACVAAPVSAMVLAFACLLGHRPLTLRLVSEIAPSALGTSLVMTCLAFLVRGPARDRPPPPESTTASAGPKLLARLPSRLQGAEIYAVEAEDHYLRLHTSLGHDLILMRLADAVAELAGLDGAQTHRSWWVARGAVARVERHDGRATLTLKDGTEAPVSRAYAKALRTAGWI